ncbi:MAG: hypothetical protein ACOX3V_04730 [Bacillota bacterium]|jgi:hypothetical protein
MSSLGNWIAAFLTVAVFSIIYKETELYYFAEQLFVGCSAGYGVAIIFGNRIKPTISVDILEKGTWHYIIPIILGLLIYFRFSTNLQWVARYPISFSIGAGAGVVLTKTWKPMFLDQIAATITPLKDPGTSTYVNAVLLFLGVLGTVAFFLFTVEPKGPTKYVSRIGRYTMMIAFGSAFGTTVMARVSLFLARMQFMLTDFLGVAK